MTCEFAAGTKGLPTENPFGLGHTPGGSSTGSAAAVSDYQCHIALGTQTVSHLPVYLSSVDTEEVGRITRQACELLWNLWLQADVRSFPGVCLMI
jgi:hypothetical protein